MDVKIPYSRCDECAEAQREGQIYLAVERKGLKIGRLELYCSTCDWKVDLLEAMKAQTDKSAKKARRISKEIVQALISLKDNLPKDKQELWTAVRDPTHPFTAALLVGLLILAMELSGFGVFMFVTWVLGNLILNPVGWVLIPIVVAIAFAFKRYFKGPGLDSLRRANKELEERRDREEISQEEFERLQKQLLKEYLSKKPLGDSSEQGG